MKMHQQIPVLGIDEFEGFGNHQEFNREFFDNLRAMAQDAELPFIIVIASRKPLIDILAPLLGETSPFFNMCETIPLLPFEKQEASTFIQTRGARAGFNEEERKYLLEYGSHGEEKWPPYRLQLICQMLLDDKENVDRYPDSYRPNDQIYWQDFKKRLEERYKMVVPK
jgi:hypothetical protein